MKTPEINETLRKMITDILVERLGSQFQDCEFDDHDSLIEGGLIDSLSVLQLVESCETTFAISIDAHELTLENWDNMATISTFVQNKLAGNTCEISA